jgi:hypothetical protein
MRIDAMGASVQCRRVSRRHRERRRSKRLLFAAMLALLAAATAALWVQSVARGMMVRRMAVVNVRSDQLTATGQLVLMSTRGRFSITSLRDEIIGVTPQLPRRVKWDALRMEPDVARGKLRAPQLLYALGFDWYWQRGAVTSALGTHQQRVLLLTVPYWLPLLVFTTTAWLLARRPLRERRRRRAGHCPACGYDIRATPQRCPECGLGAASE